MYRQDEKKSEEVENHGRIGYYRVGHVERERRVGVAGLKGETSGIYDSERWLTVWFFV